MERFNVVESLAVRINVNVIPGHAHIGSLQCERDVHSDGDIEFGNIVLSIAIGSKNESTGVCIHVGATHIDTVTEGCNGGTASFDRASVGIQTKPTSLNFRVLCFLDQGDTVDPRISITAVGLSSEETQAAKRQIIRP